MFWRKNKFKFCAHKGPEVCNMPIPPGTESKVTRLRKHWLSDYEPRVTHEYFCRTHAKDYKLVYAINTPHASRAFKLAELYPGMLFCVEEQVQRKPGGPWEVVYKYPYPEPVEKLTRLIVEIEARIVPKKAAKKLTVNGKRKTSKRA